MPKNTSQNIDVSNFIPSFFLIAYLCIGFTPNLEAVDKIAPQWLLMGFLNLLSVFYIVYSRNSFGQRITQTLSTYLSITYIGFYSMGRIFLFLCHKSHRGYCKYITPSKCLDDVFSHGLFCLQS